MAVLKVRSPFYAFRYMVSPSDKQASLLHEWEEKTKEELVHEIFLDIASEHKLSYLQGKKRFLFFHVTDYNNNMFVFNFAKQKEGRKAIEGDTDIELVEDTQLKHIMLFIHTEYQIILIERKTTAFQNINSVLKHIEWYMRDRLRHYDYTFKLYPLAKSERFWQIVDSAEAIYELSLTFNAPNFGGGAEDLRDTLQNLKNETDNDQVTVEVKSEAGNLKIKKNFFDQFIEYITTIGGTYKLRYKHEGVIEKRSNLDDIEKTNIVRHREKEYTEEELKDVETKIKEIDRRSEIDKSNGKKKKRKK